MNVQPATVDRSLSRERAVINIAADFSRYPGGRFKTDGEHSGEEFRDVLIPALRTAQKHNTRLVVELEGAVGYPSSFLEEAFGGLVRHGYFSAVELNDLLVIKAGSLFASHKLLAERYIREAQPK